MNDTQDVLRSHAFDGDIVEFDNRLPNWWLWTFYLACIFSFFYWIHYHVLKTGPSSNAEFKAALAVWDAEQAKRAVTDDDLVAKSKDQQTIALGKEVFTANCVACHGITGGGTMVIEGAAPVLLPGPNLTDKFWLHGGKPSEIHKVVTKGVAEKGMAAWETLGATKCQAVVAYVLTLRNTNAKGGKEPQGQPYEQN